MSARTTYVKVLAATLLVALAAGPVSANSIDLGDGSFLEAAPVLRDIQETIWFQGYLADESTGDPINATYTMTARMYDADVGGVSVWGPETHISVDISEGWFNIELGSVVGGLPAFDTPPYYLQLNINGELMNPRLKLASVPSAFQSLGADNGLNLPYVGAFSSSGTAFQITNTGPNICAWFKVDNPASSASAVYGQHNGTGAAVMAWHTGVGTALRAVAGGDGYAGRFEGPVVIEDSLRVAGVGVFQNSAVVLDTLLIGEGFMFTRNPVEGYVLRCADSWGNAEWGPPNIVDMHNESAITELPDGNVHQYDNCQVTLTVPGPGYIVVTTNVWFKFYHQGGVTDRLYLSNSTSSTSLGSWNNVVAWEIPSYATGDIDLDKTFTVSSTHEIVSGGTYTYYLVGQMDSGGTGDDVFWYGQMTGVYHPYPIVVRDEGEEARELEARKAYQRR